MSPTEAKLHEQVTEFNKRYKVGDKLIVIKDNGDKHVHALKAPAQVMGCHSAVAWFEGLSGCWAIERVVNEGKVTNY